MRELSEVCPFYPQAPDPGPGPGLGPDTPPPHPGSSLSSSPAFGHSLSILEDDLTGQRKRPGAGTLLTLGLDLVPLPLFIDLSFPSCKKGYWVFILVKKFMIKRRIDIEAHYVKQLKAWR